jgi:replicative DNA helicase
LCKELNVPIILFCQLNRDLYKRGGNKEPNLADLKGSGNIEEYAYQISFLHRPEYYDITEDELGESTKGLLYQIIAKHRDGKLDRLKFHFVPQCSQLRDWQSSPVRNWTPSDDAPF